MKRMLCPKQVEKDIPLQLNVKPNIITSSGPNDFLVQSANEEQSKRTQALYTKGICTQIADLMGKESIVK